jgi:hypothetical protein
MLLLLLGELMIEELKVEEDEFRTVVSIIVLGSDENVVYFLFIGDV